MGAPETDTDEQESGRFGVARYMLRLLLSVAAPVIVIGAGLWWLVGNDRVDSAISLQAAEHHRVLDEVLDAGLGAFPGAGAVVIDDARLNSAVDGVIFALVGPSELRIVHPDGSIIFSEDPAAVGERIALTDVDRQALAGVPAGARLDAGTDRVPVRYSLPWAPPNAPTAAIAQLTVLDDVSVGATEDDVEDLAYLFGGAFLALLFLLIPMCWWSLGKVRRQFRKTRILALNDNLTGLANRTQFRIRLEEAIAGADRGEDRVGIIMLDLDGFKAINDTGGHAAGDRLLKRVAGGLKDVTRRNEIACRLGGDEFAIVVPRLESRDDLVSLADRLHQRLDMNVNFSDGRSLRVTASIGMAVFPEDAVGVDDLVNAADIAMYNVKARRKAKLPHRKAALQSAVR